MVGGLFIRRWEAVFPRGSLRGRLASGAVWILAAGLGTQVIAAGLSMTIARVVGQVGFGALGIVTSTIAMFHVVAELSLGLTASKHVAELKHAAPVRVGRIIALATIVAVGTGLIMAVTVAALATPLARDVLRVDWLAGYLRLGAPLLAVSALNGLQVGVLSGFEAFRQIGTGRVVVALVSVPLTLAGVLLAGIGGVLVANIAAGLVGLVWYRIQIHRTCRTAGVAIAYRGAWQEKRVLWTFALPSVLSGLMYTPVVWAANAFLVRSGGGLADMGAFNAANQVRTLVLYVPTTLGEVALPMMAGLLGQRDARRFGRALRLNILANLAVGLSVAVPVSLCGHWILSIYGPSFRDRWPAMVCLSFAAVLQATIGVIGNVMASASRMWWGFVLNLLWAVELLTAAWFLVRWGANGLGAAYLIAYLLHLLQVGWYTVRVLRHDDLCGDRPAPGTTGHPEDVPGASLPA